MIIRYLSEWLKIEKIVDIGMLIGLILLGYKGYIYMSTIKWILEILIVFSLIKIYYYIIDNEEGKKVYKFKNEKVNKVWFTFLYYFMYVWNFWYFLLYWIYCKIYDFKIWINGSKDIFFIKYFNWDSQEFFSKVIWIYFNYVDIVLKRLIYQPFWRLIMLPRLIKLLIHISEWKKIIYYRILALGYIVMLYNYLRLNILYYLEGEIKIYVIFLIVYLYIAVILPLIMYYIVKKLKSQEIFEKGKYNYESNLKYLINLGYVNPVYTYVLEYLRFFCLEEDNTSIIRIMLMLKQLDKEVFEYYYIKNLKFYTYYMSWYNKNLYYYLTINLTIYNSLYTVDLEKNLDRYNYLDEKEQKILFWNYNKNYSMINSLLIMNLYPTVYLKNQNINFVYLVIIEILNMHYYINFTKNLYNDVDLMLEENKKDIIKVGFLYINLFLLIWESWSKYYKLYVYFMLDLYYFIYEVRIYDFYKLIEFCHNIKIPNKNLEIFQNIKIKNKNFNIELNKKFQKVYENLFLEDFILEDRIEKEYNNLNIYEYLLNKFWIDSISQNWLVQKYTLNGVGFLTDFKAYNETYVLDEQGNKDFLLFPYLNNKIKEYYDNVIKEYQEELKKGNEYPSIEYSKQPWYLNKKEDINIFNIEKIVDLYLEGKNKELFNNNISIFFNKK